jgi:hypothetical protein
MVQPSGCNRAKKKAVQTKGKRQLVPQVTI